jgi:hypothetical protein
MPALDNAVAAFSKRNDEGEPKSYDGNNESAATIERPGRILTCPITGCASPTVLYTATNDTALQSLAVDERFVYLGGSGCSSDVVDFTHTYQRCHHITAIPK